MSRKLNKRTHKGYEKVATDDLDDIADHYGPEDVPVPKVLHDFDPNVRSWSAHPRRLRTAHVVHLNPGRTLTAPDISNEDRWRSGCAVAT